METCAPLICCKARALTNSALFDRDLESLTQLPDFGGVVGLVIGRFERASKITQDELSAIIMNKKALLKDMPVIANVDFGHTEPKITFPIGGMCALNAATDMATIKIMRH
ncbi:MAG: microcin C7 resistance protein MccF-like protein [Parcubacteria group bacterium]